MKRFCRFGIDSVYFSILAGLLAVTAATRPALARSSKDAVTADYERAARALPEFCREWHSKLEERVSEQADLMEWQDREGWKTATYRGYGPIESCTCKLQDGVPVGEITYQTIEYYLAGHTVEEARHARPIVAGRTHTIEILRWKDGRWVYE